MNDKNTKITLEDLGYDEFDLKRESLGLVDSLVARVIAEHKEAYTVKNTDGEYLAKITGKQMFNAIEREDYPAVGDWVVITELDRQRAVIQEILPRKTILKKRHSISRKIILKNKNSNKLNNQIIATNLDCAFIVESLDRDYSLNRFERYLVIANEGGIKPVIILNKIDLITKTELNVIIDQIINRFGNIDIISTSTITDHGLSDLMQYIKRGKTYCFLGSSGVGKSSLINKLLQSNEIKIREISNVTGKGKHTTTARGMYFLGNGGIVIDNPGTREVGIADAGTGIENVFDEITILSKECKYSDCTHAHEPGCAVLKALKDNKLEQDRYQNYLKLKKENEFYSMTDFEKKQKERKFGQFIKIALDQLKEVKP